MLTIYIDIQEAKLYVFRSSKGKVMGVRIRDLLRNIRIRIQGIKNVLGDLGAY